MKTEKMSFKNIKDVLSRDEMKSIMAGSGGGGATCSGCVAGGISYTCGTDTVGGRTICSCPAANSTTNNC